MSQYATVFGASAPDRLSRLIQKRVFGDRVKIPLEIRLWGGRTYRFGAGEPAVKSPLEVLTVDNDRHNTEPAQDPAYASSCRSDRSVRVGFDRPAPPLWRSGSPSRAHAVCRSVLRPNPSL